MSKELEALERLRNTLLLEGYYQDVLQDVATIETALKRLDIIDHGIDLTDEERDKVAKKIKALEIIKEKSVSVGTLQLYGFCLKEYNIYRPHKTLTQEEFDLLKEVLK